MDSPRITWCFGLGLPDGGPTVLVFPFEVWAEQSVYAHDVCTLLREGRDLDFADQPFDGNDACNLGYSVILETSPVANRWGLSTLRQLSMLVELPGFRAWVKGTQLGEVR